jgi:TPP-dependent pyruvate/acetoin dehydrogenase alpha subunit|tara:strand:- start:2844 stop:3470 length:627 start_codon:yes stop_codon:yes gene_type:complete
MQIPEKFKKVREINITPEELIDFETRVKEKYEKGEIGGPIHLSKNNEKELIEIFQYIHQEDWVFVPWRNHYQALLHGVDQDKLFNSISDGNSMHTNNVKPNFYSSSIVGGIIPLALGTAMALKEQKSYKRVWCFVGDMTMETGIFHEAYKYAKNFDLPLNWVIEDNNMSVHTPTDLAWKNKQEVPKDVIYYSYEMGYPHHGTGNWVNF